MDDRHAEEAIGEDDDGQQTEMFARATSIFHSQSHQQKFREQRKLRGHASNPLEVGKFVAYVPDYTDDTPTTARHDFWVGKIIELSPNTDQLKVQRWHTNPTNNLESARAKYRVWQGAGAKNEWLENWRVLEQFKLTTQGKLIESRVRGLIRNAITLHEACNNGVLPDVAVGSDMLENRSRPDNVRSSEDEDEDEEGEDEEGDDEDM